LLKNFLTKQHFEVVVSHKLSDGLEQAVNFSPDIIFLDNNLPADFVDQQNKIVANMTKAEIDALAKKWIKHGKMNVLVVGDKANILSGLQKLGYEIIELDADGKPVEKKAF